MHFGTNPADSRIAGRVIIEGQIKPRKYVLRIGRDDIWIWEGFRTSTRDFTYDFDKRMPAQTDELIRGKWQILVYVVTISHQTADLNLIYTKEFSFTSEFFLRFRLLKFFSICNSLILFSCGCRGTVLQSVKALYFTNGLTVFSRQAKKRLGCRLSNFVKRIMPKSKT